MFSENTHVQSKKMQLIVSNFVFDSLLVIKYTSFKYPSQLIKIRFLYMEYKGYWRMGIAAINK